MYAFSWISRVYGPMYIKFCLVRKREEVDLLVLYSFHRSRPGYRA
jgi:hypothetical protein